MLFRPQGESFFDLLIDELAVATDDPEHADLQPIYDQLAVPGIMIV